MRKREGYGFSKKYTIPNINYEILLKMKMLVLEVPADSTPHTMKLSFIFIIKQPTNITEISTKLNTTRTAVLLNLIIMICKKR